MIKLILLDIDGVMTDGRKYYDSEGKVVLKTFCDKDWTAIKRFKAIGVEIMAITGDPYNAKILENRNIPYIVNRGKGFHSDKSNYLEEIVEKYKISPENIGYIGDDIFDIGLMKKIKYAFCPADSTEIVKNYAQELSVKAGENVIKVLFDILETKRLIPKIDFESTIEKIYELDIKESF